MGTVDVSPKHKMLIPRRDKGRHEAIVVNGRITAGHEPILDSLSMSVPNLTARNAPKDQPITHYYVSARSKTGLERRFGVDLPGASVPLDLLTEVVAADNRTQAPLNFVDKLDIGKHRQNDVNV